MIYENYVFVSLALWQPATAGTEHSRAKSEAESSEAELGESLLYPRQWIAINKWLEWFSKDWNAPVYVFYEPIPDIGYEGGCHYHSFQCAAKGCKQHIHRYLD